MVSAGIRLKSGSDEKAPPRGGARTGLSASPAEVGPAPAPKREVGGRSRSWASSAFPLGAEGRIGRSLDTTDSAGLEKARA